MIDPESTKIALTAPFPNISKSSSSDFWHKHTGEAKQSHWRRVQVQDAIAMHKIKGSAHFVH